ncbi:transposable element Tcb1 transposase [Trichonephila clavipes]|nr:transposable element Tcb1 transposase [Trichonephila clavipes]
MNETVRNQRWSKCGAPQAIDDRSERRLWRCVRMNKRATVEQLTIQMNQGATSIVSQTTVQQTLLYLGLQSSHVVPYTYAIYCSLATKAGICTPVLQMDIH